MTPTDRRGGIGSRLSALALLAFLILLGPTGMTSLPGSSAGTWGLEQKITPDDADEATRWGEAHAFVNFGSSVAIDGDLLVAASAVDRKEFYTWAYVFEQSSDGDWIQDAKLSSPGYDPLETSGFGGDVAVDQQTETVVVGDPGYDAEGAVNVGRAYVFERSANGSWELSAELPNPSDNGTAFDVFGSAVDVSGDTIAVGAYLWEASSTSSDEGAVFLYEREADGSWKLDETIAVGDPGEMFGSPVSLDGDRMAVGSGGADVAYTFEQLEEGWVKTAVLTPPPRTIPQPEYFSCFGSAVAVRGDVVVVGEPCWEHGVSTNAIFSWAGRVHVFSLTPDGWDREALLEPLDHTPGMEFGWSTDVDDDVVVVGSRMAPARFTAEGSAYVFEKTMKEWTQVAKLRGPDTGPYDQFGRSVAIDAGTAVVGAPFDDNRGDLPHPLDDDGDVPPCVHREIVWGCDDGESAGSVYAFEPRVSRASVSSIGLGQAR